MVAKHIKNMQKRIINSPRDLKYLGQKYKNKQIVLCHGVFDLLHIGHINHFKEAKNLGDILVVSITADNFVNKGPRRPLFNSEQRSNSILALENVDYVFINNSLTATEVIKNLKPKIYCKGKDYKDNDLDYTNQIIEEKKAIKSVKGQIIYTKSEIFSSSKIINLFSNNLSKENKSLISKIKNKYSFKKIKKILDKAHNLKIMIVGETIIDEYVFCDAVGKSGKEPVLVLKEMKSEQYYGGAAAIAKHISNFSNNISLLTMLGEKNEFKSGLKKNLSKIKIEHISKTNSPTIVKKRFLDHITKSKVLGVYKIDDEPLNKKDEINLIQKIRSKIKKNDLVIISDYGHGFITDKVAKYLCKNSKFLALNTQINASNISYHSIEKYNKIDFFLINEREIRHEFRDRKNKAEILMKKISIQKKINHVVLTRGSKGSILYNRKKNSYFYCEALTDKIVDKVGAGDSMLSIISICIKIGFDEELSLFLGSLAAVQSLESLANKETTSKLKMLRSIEYLLK